jgi:hypothetical protein
MKDELSLEIDLNEDIGKRTTEILDQINNRILPEIANHYPDIVSTNTTRSDTKYNRFITIRVIDGSSPDKSSVDILLQYLAKPLQNGDIVIAGTVKTITNFLAEASWWDHHISMKEKDTPYQIFANLIDKSRTKDWISIERPKAYPVSKIIAYADDPSKIKAIKYLIDGNYNKILMETLIEANPDSSEMNMVIDTSSIGISIQKVKLSITKFSRELDAIDLMTKKSKGYEITATFEENRESINLYTMTY